jgi:hypothetical protein
MFKLPWGKGGRDAKVRGGDSQLAVPEPEQGDMAYLGRIVLVWDGGAQGPRRGSVQEEEEAWESTWEAVQHKVTEHLHVAVGSTMQFRSQARSQCINKEGLAFLFNFFFLTVLRFEFRASGSLSRLSAT